RAGARALAGSSGLRARWRARSRGEAGRPAGAGCVRALIRTRAGVPVRWRGGTWNVATRPAGARVRTGIVLPCLAAPPGAGTRCVAGRPGQAGATGRARVSGLVRIPVPAAADCAARVAEPTRVADPARVADWARAGDLARVAVGTRRRTRAAGPYAGVRRIANRSGRPVRSRVPSRTRRAGPPPPPPPPP